MENFLAWAFMFASAAAGMILGFFGMANRRREVLLEIASFSVAAVGGLCAATAIHAILHERGNYYAMSITMACAATLYTSIPRMIHQSWAESHVTIGFLMRLSAYVAVLLTLVRINSSAGPLALLIIALAPLAVIFFLIRLIVSSRFAWTFWIAWLPLSYLSIIGFVLPLLLGLSSTAWGWTIFDPRLWTTSDFELAAGNLVFHPIVALAHFLSLQISDEATQTSGAGADDKDFQNETIPTDLSH